MEESRLLRFYGSVQGVGFRWTARGLADTHGVTGYVCNLPDGSLELLAEGEAGILDAFLAELQAEMGSYIARQTCSTYQPTKAYDSFSITH